MYAKTLLAWIAGTITRKQIELLVKTKWLTRQQADVILATEQEAPESPPAPVVSEN
jgi:hypothetical protein